MNSTEEQNNKSQGEASSTNSDSNANITHQRNGSGECKGAVPKTKPAVKIKSCSNKRPAKTNNNSLGNLPMSTRKLQNEILKLNEIMNGFSVEVPAESAADRNCACDGYVKVSHRDSDSRTTMKCDDKTVNYFQNTSCRDKSDSSINVNVNDSSEDSLSLSDDGCIYTYKGDQVADLPTSFFSLDMPLSESPNPPNRENFSPEMDFLEMDFDPGPSGDIDSDSAPSELELEDKDEQSSKDVGDDKVAEPADEIVSSKSNHDVDVVDKIPSEIKIDPSYCVASSSSGNKVQVSKVMVENAESTPWTCNISERTMSKGTCSSSKRYHNVKGELVSPSDSVKKEWLDSLGGKGSTMIWSESEAYSKQITQIAPSACGATAVLNVLTALRLPVPSPTAISDVLVTRTRANSGPLTEYLLSRSVAGTTHGDLIDCLYQISNEQVYSRFFHMYPERVVNLHSWLGFWIEKGAVPIATLNLQKCKGGTVPDAWHHQMIFGVCTEGVYMTNPLEFVEMGCIWPQLCSESELLVRRDDVMSRWNFKTDVRALMKIQDHRWRQLNVVGEYFLNGGETQ